MAIDHRPLLERFYHAFNTNDMKLVEELVAPSIVDHHPGPGQPQGKAGLQQSLSEFITAFPDIHIENLAIICEGDIAMVRSRCTGTHTGPGPLPGMKATGNAVDFTAIDNWRIEDNKLVEVWHVEEIAQLLYQLRPKKHDNIVSD